MLGLGGSILTADYKVFSPADFGSLDVWYDFSTLTGSDDDDIVSFANAGIAGSDYNLAQSTASKRPHISTDEMQLNSARFNNAAAMQFALDNTYLSTDKTFTIFMVLRVDDVGTTIQENILAGETTGASQISSYNTRNITTRFNGAVNSGSLNGAVIQLIDSTGQDEYTGSSSESTTQYEFTTGDELFVIVRRSDNEIRTFNKNGDLVGLSTSKTNNHEDTNMSLRYMGGFSNAANCHNGTIGEIGIYNKELKDVQAQELCAHLKSKWSI
tara:strand:- start:373 stop:1182 length:810 start_codon:yes stop_codon:yes gene_type:complete